MAQDFEITGKAGNAKYGAVIISSDNDVYYIHKLDSWSHEFLDKQVKVTGKLVIKKLGTTSKYSGGITASSIKVIKRPKIKIVTP